MNLMIDLPQSTIKGLPGEIYVSILIFIIILIFCSIVYFKARKADPFKKPKGILLIAEMLVTFIDNFVIDTMGKQFKRFSPLIAFFCVYVFLAFTIGLFGFPTPMTYYMVPLSMAMVTFVLIHAVSIYYTRWKYFKRYISPFPFFLPINLISMWAPLLSLSLRMFGNALAGYVIMNLVYGIFTIISENLFGVLLPIAGVITPVLHAYFDLFSSFIQTTVFVFLTMLLIQAEAPSEEEMEQSNVKKKKKVEQIQNSK